MATYADKHYLEDLDHDAEGYWWLCSCADVDTGWRGPFFDVAERDASIDAHRRWNAVGPISPDAEPIHPDWDPISNPNPTDDKAR